MRKAFVTPGGSADYSRSVPVGGDVPPYPGPLPQGEGESYPVLQACPQQFSKRQRARIQFAALGVFEHCCGLKSALRWYCRDAPRQGRATNSAVKCLVLAWHLIK